jgi:hypothetical protein
MRRAASIVTFMTMALTMTSCRAVYQKFGWEADTPLEEAVESIIHFETGIPIEFSPWTEGHSS